MRSTKVVWNRVSPRPDKAGHYLVWSKDRGLRLISHHPDWWNGQDPYSLGKIEAYAYLGEGLGYAARMFLKPPRKPRKKRRAAGKDGDRG